MLDDGVHVLKYHLAQSDCGTVWLVSSTPRRMSSTTLSYATHRTATTSWTTLGSSTSPRRTPATRTLITPQSTGVRGLAACTAPNQRSIRGPLSRSWTSMCVTSHGLGHRSVSRRGSGFICVHAESHCITQLRDLILSRV